jgi:hypothetical protein
MRENRLEFQEMGAFRRKIQPFVEFFSTWGLLFWIGFAVIAIALFVMWSLNHWLSGN